MAFAKEPSPYFIQSVFAITPSDATTYNPPLRCLYVGGAGNISLTFMDDTTAVFTGVPVGTQLAVGKVKKVNSTSTTATLILAGKD